MAPKTSVELIKGTYGWEDVHSVLVRKLVVLFLVQKWRKLWLNAAANWEPVLF